MSKKRLTGKVISDKMQKTVVVAVGVHKRHPVYNKGLIKTKKFLARNEMGVAEGDNVIIEETRPHSKNVTWKVVEKVEGK
jgi:small subunit ribosomal protein S17